MFLITLWKKLVTENLKREKPIDSHRLYVENRRIERKLEEYRGYEINFAECFEEVQVYALKNGEIKFALGRFKPTATNVIEFVKLIKNDIDRAIKDLEQCTSSTNPEARPENMLSLH